VVTEAHVGLTRLLQTDRAYRKIVSTLCRRADRGATQSLTEAPQTFVDWLVSNTAAGESRAGCSRATWRLYRAAVAFVLATDQPDGWGEALARLRAARPSGLAARAARQPGRARSCTRARLARLARTMIAINPRHAALVLLWFEATRLTGLRPCEWPTARVEARALGECATGPWLVVINAKNTNRRAPGPLRRLDLSPLSTGQRQVVLRWQAFAAGLGPKEFPPFQARLMRFISRANASAFRNRKHSITLYTMRHVCVALGKRHLCHAGLAALLGHRSVETATRNYARRARGAVTPPIARPDPSLTAAIAAANARRGPLGRPPRAVRHELGPRR
jgi:integrase